MPCVYIIKSIKTNRLYIGSSHKNSPQERLMNHNAKKVRSTKFYAPWTLIIFEKYNTYTDARKRELFLKSGARVV